MEMLSYEEIKEHVGEEPDDLPDSPRYQVIDEKGNPRTFDNLQNAEIIKARTGNEIKIISFSKEEILKNKQEQEEYFSKVNHIWFDQLCEIYQDLDPETIRLLYNQLIEFSMEDQGYFDPDEISDRIETLLPVFDSYFQYILGNVTDVRKAFYFKESNKKKMIKL